MPSIPQTLDSKSECNTVQYGTVQYNVVQYSTLGSLLCAIAMAALECSAVLLGILGLMLFLLFFVPYCACACGRSAGHQGLLEEQLKRRKQVMGQNGKNRGAQPTPQSGMPGGRGTGGGGGGVVGKGAPEVEERERAGAVPSKRKAELSSMVKSLKRKVASYEV